MAPKRSSRKKDDQRSAQEGKCGRQKVARHIFTKDDLEILEHSFEQNPYPPFTTKGELADQLCCDFYDITKWFKDRRSRLPPREKNKIFAIWKTNRSRVKKCQPLDSPDGWAQPDNSSMSQTPLHDQETLLHRAAYSSQDTQMGPSGLAGSGDSVVTVVDKEPRRPLEYQGAPANRSSTSTADTFINPNTSMQCFVNARSEAGESQNALSFFSYYAFTGQGTGQQQQKYEAPCQYSTFQGQQPNLWGYHQLHLPQPQYYQHSYQLLPFQGQVWPCETPGGSWPQGPALPPEQQSSGGAPSSPLQRAPVHTAARFPPPLEQEKQQGDAEHSGYEVQHLQNGVYAGVHC